MGNGIDGFNKAADLINEKLGTSYTGAELQQKYENRPKDYTQKWSESIKEDIDRDGAVWGP